MTYVSFLKILLSLRVKKHLAGEGGLLNGVVSQQKHLTRVQRYMESSQKLRIRGLSLEKMGL